MVPNHENISKLWALYLGDQATPEQVDELFAFIRDPQNDEANLHFYQQLTGEDGMAGMPGDKAKAAAVLHSIVTENKELYASLGHKFRQEPEERKPPVYKLSRRQWIAIAAGWLLLATGPVIWRYLKPVTRGKQQEVAITVPKDSSIFPGGEKAELVLADGSTITLDSAANGQLASQGNAQVIKLEDGRLEYQTDPGAATAPLMNTMRTPKGGQYQLTLPDGTRVWLNAASSITFPVAFTGSDRKVSITGEAYFEVMQNRHQPFRVDISGHSTIEVLGTSFNVNNYQDDGNIQTTLLQGSIRVQDQQKNVQLRPGQQAISNGKDISVKTTADLQQVMAWKNGIFNFNNTELTQVMKQLERWYNIEVKYEGKPPSIRLKGEMDRGVQLTDVQRFLTSYGISNRLENRILVISDK